MRSFWYRDRQCGKGRPVCAGPGQRICLASRQAADWLAGWAFGAGPCPRDGQDNCSQCTLSVQACQESVIHGENSRRKCLQAAVRHRLCGGREPPGQGEKRTREGRWFDASSSGRAQAVVQTSSCLSETLILKRAMQKYKRKCESCDIMSMTSFSRGEYALVLPREHKEHLVPPVQGPGKPSSGSCSESRQDVWSDLPAAGMRFFAGRSLQCVFQKVCPASHQAFQGGGAFFLLLSGSPSASLY